MLSLSAAIMKLESMKVWELEQENKYFSEFQFIGS